MSAPTNHQRVRLTFAKGGAMRFTSHLDLARTWERTLRRAEMPLAYSQGFNPRPQIQLAAALPLGYVGKNELMDMILVHPLPLDTISERISAVLPNGLTLIRVEEVPLSAPSLQSQVRSAAYRVYLDGDVSDQAVRDRVTHFLAQNEFPWTRRSHKGKVRQIDLRALVKELTLSETATGQPVLEMRLQHDSELTGRPDEVMAALDLADAVKLIERTELESEQVSE